MSSSSNAASEVSLTKREDWPAWSRRFESTARQTKVWEYVDPAAQPALTLKVPEEVTYDGELARINRQLLGDSGTLGDETPASSQPTNQLNEAQLRIFMIHQTDYEIRYARYALLAEAIDKLTAWVHRTVDPSLMRLFSDTADLRAVYTKLQDLVGMTNAEQVVLARMNYRKVLQQANRRRMGGIEWHRQWELAYREGLRLAIVEIQGDLGVADFLNAVQTYDNSWAMRYLDKLREQQREGSVTMTLEFVSRLFLHAVRDRVKSTY